MGEAAKGEGAIATLKLELADARKTIKGLRKRLTAFEGNDVVEAEDKTGAGNDAGKAAEGEAETDGKNE